MTTATAHGIGNARLGAIADRIGLFMVAFVQGAGATVLLAGAVAASYLVKSALGIDLLPGPSPLHDLLYPLVARQ